MSNAYMELQERQQQDVNSFPIGAAFGQKQFRQMMERWGFTEEDTDKIVSLGAGCFIRKSDKQAYIDMCKRHHEELAAAIAADKTGEGFIYDMFLYELENHEYGYTGDASDALDALHMTLERINSDQRLVNGFFKAIQKIDGCDPFDGGEEEDT